MSEKVEQIFSHKEVVEALLKHKGIHDGEWMMAVKFGLSGINVGPNNDQLNPAALIPVLSIGITKTKKKSNLSVNAAEVNPE